jgi:hypothetical protein
MLAIRRSAIIFVILLGYAYVRLIGNPTRWSPSGSCRSSPPRSSHPPSSAASLEGSDLLGAWLD